MIMINGNWEQVNDLSDIIRIVNKNIGYEFAQKVEEIFEKRQQKYTQDLENIIKDLKDCKQMINRMKGLLLGSFGE